MGVDADSLTYGRPGCCGRVVAPARSGGLAARKYTESTACVFRGLLSRVGMVVGAVTLW